VAKASGVERNAHSGTARGSHMIQLALEAFTPEFIDSDSLSTRSCVIQQKAGLREKSADLSKEARSQPANSPERNRLYKVIQDTCNEQSQLEALLESDFMPQHGPRQLISPRAFFVSPLFRVGSKKVARERSVTLQMKNSQGGLVFTYNGPELRQSDGLVFMALLNLTRDVRLGETVSFQAEELCRNIFGRYDGPTRQLLQDHIKRLQRALIEFDRFSVQLCLRFDYAARGAWKVALDKDIVQLFRRSTDVWLDLPRRQALPEGLSTWLYGFVESQTKLIPMPVETLHELCGSDAHPESFIRMFRLALKDLTSQEVIDAGWTLKKGLVHWRKSK
jgi:hypothetical protein